MKMPRHRNKQTECAADRVPETCFGWKKKSCTRRIDLTGRVASKGIGEGRNCLHEGSVDTVGKRTLRRKGDTLVIKKGANRS